MPNTEQSESSPHVVTAAPVVSLIQDNATFRICHPLVRRVPPSTSTDEQTFSYALRSIKIQFPTMCVEERLAIPIAPRGVILGFIVFCLMLMVPYQCLADVINQTKLQENAFQFKGFADDTTLAISAGVSVSGLKNWSIIIAQFKAPDGTWDIKVTARHKLPPAGPAHLGEEKGDNVATVEVIVRDVSPTRPRINKKASATINHPGAVMHKDVLQLHYTQIDKRTSQLSIQVDHTVDGAVISLEGPLDRTPPKIVKKQWVFKGTAKGGRISAIINGCPVGITTTAKQSATMVAASFAAAVTDDPCITDLAIDATASGDTVTIMGVGLTVSATTVADTGLQHFMPVPTLSQWGIIILTLLLCMAILWRVRLLRGV